MYLIIKCICFLLNHIILEYIMLQRSAFVFLAQMFLNPTATCIARQGQMISMKRWRTSSQMFMDFYISGAHISCVPCRCYTDVCNTVLSPFSFLICTLSHLLLLWDCIISRIKRSIVTIVSSICGLMHNAIW